MTDIPPATTKKIMQRHFDDQAGLVRELFTLINEGWSIKHVKEIHERKYDESYFLALPPGFYEIEVYDLER